ncbi:MAG: DUF4402 domain-containing protein [Balneolaceae bacterium]|nr:DUF4402 domain-containing protein [Balneolaceae bacterium]
MKTLKTIIPALTFIMLFSFAANAQTAVTATADILQDVAYDVDNNISFGELEASFGSATLDPTNTSGDSGVNGTAGTDYNAGRINITGSGSNDVTVTLDNASVDLTNGGTSDVLSLSVTLSQATDDVNTDRGGASFTSGNTVTLSSGAATLWIGGTLTSADNDGGGIATGTYENTTDLTFTLDYSL